MIKISTIVPLYYGTKYIRDIESMLQRNINYCCKFNLDVSIELIFVNDSPDELIKENAFALYDVLDVKILTNEINKGIHYSRVIGLKAAQGEYILFLDQDDIISDKYIYSQITNMEKDTDVIVSNGIEQKSKCEKVLYKYYLMQWTVKYAWFYAKYDCRIISPGQCLIKKDKIPSYWMDNILKYNGTDDYLLWMLMLEKGCKFDINRDILYTHVATDFNVSNNKIGMSVSLQETIQLLEPMISKKYIAIIHNRIHKGKSVLVRMVEKINTIR